MVPGIGVSELTVFVPAGIDTSKFETTAGIGGAGAGAADGVIHLQ